MQAGVVNTVLEVDSTDISKGGGKRDARLQGASVSARMILTSR